jgi:hypothetical protein
MASDGMGYSTEERGPYMCSARNKDETKNVGNMASSTVKYETSRKSQKIKLQKVPNNIAGFCNYMGVNLFILIR